MTMDISRWDADAWMDTSISFLSLCTYFFKYQCNRHKNNWDCMSSCKVVVVTLQWGASTCLCCTKRISSCCFTCLIQHKMHRHVSVYQGEFLKQCNGMQWKCNFNRYFISCLICASSSSQGIHPPQSCVIVFLHTF